MAEQELLRMGKVGTRLRWARRAAKMTIADVAERTKVSTYYLLALENDEFERLPSRVHTFGFAKAFAKAVQTDEEALASALRQQLDAQSALTHEAESANRQPSQRRGFTAMLRNMSSF